jgi:hypothetical protein
MTQLILDEATAAKLRQAAGSVELIDPSGRTVGVFTPPVDRALYEGVECPVSNEELARREREEPRFTTAEVLAHLKSLEQS